MLSQKHPNLRSRTLLLAIGAYALTFGTANAYSSGNGGSQPAGEYHAALPNLNDGQTANPLLDIHQRLIIAPSSYPTNQPVSPASGSTFPVSASGTLPTHETGVASTTVSNFPSVQAVAPAVSASPFPVVQASGANFVVSGTVNIGNPASGAQLVAPTASNTAFNVNCVSGCGGSGTSGSTTSQGVYNTTLPTYTSGQTVTAQYDINGRAIISPLTISLPGPLPISEQYNASPINLANGVYGIPQIDQNGYTLLSPQSNIQTGGGIYQLNPPPLADGQVTQVRVDAQANTMVRAAVPIPVTVEQIGNLTDGSNSISVANTSQLLMNYDLTRRGFMIQNTSTGDLWINLTGAPATSASPSFKVAAGTTFQTPPFFPSSNPVAIFGATAGATYSVVKW